MSYSATVLADLPCAFWELDETTGTVAADATGLGGRDLAYQASPTLAQATLVDAGTSILLNGSSQFVSATAADGLSADELSVEFWIKTNTAALSYICDSDFVASTRWFFINTTTAGLIQFAIFNTGASGVALFSVTAVNNNSPHHVVCTFDGRLMKIYIDGALDATSTAGILSGNMQAGNSGICLGANSNGAGSFTNPLAGTLQHVTVYGKCLTAARVTAHFTVPGGSTYNAEVAADAPTGWWKLNDTVGSTTAADSGSGGNALTIRGAPTLGVADLTGYGGTAVTFSNGNNFQKTTSATGLNFKARITLEGWIKTSTATCQIVCSDDATGLKWFRLNLNSGKPEFVYYDAGNTSHSVAGPSNINDGQIHYVVGTYDGTTLCIYVDGTLVNSSTTSFTPTTGGGTVQVGARRSNSVNSQFLSGNIDEIAIYKYALSAAQILAHWTASGHAVTTSIKTVQGVAYATSPQVKTVMGVPIANVKTIDGLA